MKTVYDIIWSDLFDDEVSVTIFDVAGYQLTSSCFRFDDEVSSWESSEVYSAEYFPITNSLDIFLNYYSKEAIDHDPT